MNRSFLALHLLLLGSCALPRGAGSRAEDGRGRRWPPEEGRALRIERVLPAVPDGLVNVASRRQGALVTGSRTYGEEFGAFEAGRHTQMGRWDPAELNADGYVWGQSLFRRATRIEGVHIGRLCHDTRFPAVPTVQVWLLDERHRRRKVFESAPSDFTAEMARKHGGGCGLPARGYLQLARPLRARGLYVQVKVDDSGDVLIGDYYAFARP